MNGRPGDICSLIGFVIPRCQRAAKQWDEGAVEGAGGELDKEQ